MNKIFSPWAIIASFTGLVFVASLLGGEETTPKPATQNVTPVVVSEPQTVNQEPVEKVQPADTQKAEEVQEVKESNVQVKEEPKVIQKSVSCGEDYYRNVDGNCVHRPSNSPSGASAKCRDGSYSYSQNRRGTCSGHGGVASWL